MEVTYGAGLDTDKVTEARKNVGAGKLDGHSSKPSPHDPQDQRELVLAELRHFSLRLKLIASEVDLTGFQLRIGVIDVETAIARTANIDDPLGLLDREVA